ncbi:hypothetical protein CXX84_03595 [Arthrobacter sp. AFG7.2]|uniref:GDSL-type esterase/lipase family protein n=1 Tax=Arthrobacter sp. AFG7.2 TaxID=1688693 RepID=UPI000C9E7273|nr:GDSL-type esterase/lipase family protein [Arthrobacter sp. AFG7.2]PNI10545.1 hypothetical protein CXX84_03595 [Arthrobacter sp. AFG7.2]
MIKGKDAVAGAYDEGMEPGGSMTHSVLQVGDSLSNGDSIVIGHVPSMAWGGWLAFANGWSFTRHSVTGRTSAQVADDLLPRAGFGFTVGCFTAGANDVAGRTWDSAVTEENLRVIWKGMSDRCEHVLALRLPDSYFRLPSVPASVYRRTAEVNQMMEGFADEFGGSLVNINDFRGARYVRPDQVHFTSVGDLAIASRAAGILTRRGLTTTDPATLGLGDPVSPISPARQVAFATGFARQTAKQTAKRLLGRF